MPRKNRFNKRKYPNRKRNRLERDYSNPAYAQFRKEVKDRDGRKCQWPGCSTKKKLEVHHIKQWSKYPSMRFDPSNGITLCKRCHERIKGNEEVYEVFFIKLLEWQMLNKIKEMDEDV